VIAALGDGEMAALLEGRAADCLLLDWSGLQHDEPMIKVPADVAEADLTPLLAILADRPCFGIEGEAGGGLAALRVLELRSVRSRLDLGVKVQGRATSS
jgi:hypothetical protein